MTSPFDNPFIYRNDIEPLDTATAYNLVQTNRHNIVKSYEEEVLNLGE